MPSRSYERETQSAMFQPPVDHPLVGRDVVAHQRQDHHHDVLGDADAVAVGDLGDGDPAVDRRLEVDVVRADPGGDRELQLRRLGDPLGGQVRGPERLRDDDVGVGQLALEDRVGPVLVGGDDQLVAAAPRGSARRPSSPETLPSSSPGVKSIASGVGVGLAVGGSPRSSGSRRARTPAGSRRPGSS